MTIDKGYEALPVDLRASRLVEREMTMPREHLPHSHAERRREGLIV